MHRFSRSSWASLAFACSILLASAAVAAGGGRGGHDGGNHGGSGERGGGSHKGDGGGKGNGGGKRDRGDKGSSSRAGKGGHGAHKGRTGESGHRADRPNKHSDQRFENQRKGAGGHGGRAAGSKRPDRAVSGPSLTLDLVAADTAAPAAAIASAITIATNVALSRGERPSIELPATLQPPRGSNREALIDSFEPLTPKSIVRTPGIPDDVVRACRAAIEAAAAPFGAIDVRVSSAGSTYRSSPDTLSVPIDVSIDYARQGGVETRQSPVTCDLNAAGTVIGLT